MIKSELEIRTFIIVEILEHDTTQVAGKTIIRKTKGNVTAVSFDSDDAFTEHTEPVDVFIQVIEGHVRMLVSDNSVDLGVGQSIMIPANATKKIIKLNSFKIISSMIK